MAVEERARIAEVGVVEEPAQARLDGDPDPRGREPPREVDEEADDRHGDDQPEQRQEPVAMLPVDRIVDHELGQHGNRDREPGEGERARETEPDQATLLPPEGEEPPQGGADGEIGRVDGAHGRETPGRAEARGWRVDRRCVELATPLEQRNAGRGVERMAYWHDGLLSASRDSA